MKAKTFENLIRKVVREEIDYALRREIKSLKEDLREEIIIEEQPKNIFPPKKSMKEEIMGSQPSIPKKPFKKHNFVKDSMLNSLLNETARGDTNLNSGHARMSMDPSFETAGVGDVPIEAVPESVANAVTRDYSDLMNAMKNKKR